MDWIKQLTTGDESRVVTVIACHMNSAIPGGSGALSLLP
jgi:hypothetical protein